MEVSLFLARVMGLYFIIVSLFMLARHKAMVALIKEMTNHQGTMFLSALITLIIGILLVVSHNVWIGDWRVVITIISWLIFVSGIIRLFYIDAAKTMVKWWLKRPNRLIIAAIVYLILGVYLFFVSMGM